jgi:hypothetical protein
MRVGVEVTTRVLTEASIWGKIDHLRGLKENVRARHADAHVPHRRHGVARCKLVVLAN